MDQNAELTPTGKQVQTARLWEGKPWHGLSYELKRILGKKVVKLSLDGGFTCPNRDGTLGTAGCSFCGAEGSGGHPGQAGQSLALQIIRQKQILERKWPQAGAIAYFQSFTGTYGDPGALEKLYLEALDTPGILGIAIGTRPDCLSPEVLAVLERLQTRTFLWIELGLQTIHDTTAERFGRGYAAACFYKAYAELRQRNIPVVVHLINGLPGENTAMMLESAKAVASLQPWGIKLHLLHVIRGTRLGKEWAQGNYEPMGMTDYVSLIADQLEILPPETSIHRLTGDGLLSELLAPEWSRNKKAVLGAIEVEMKNRGSWQGCRYGKK